jgi:hypothetical protein
MVRVPNAPRGKATICVNMTPLDEQGANLTAIETSIAAAAGGWTRIAAAGEIPATIRGKRVKSVRLIVIVDGFQPGEEVHLDDVAMYRLE